MVKKVSKKIKENVIRALAFARKITFFIDAYWFEFIFSYYCIFNLLTSLIYLAQSCNWVKQFWLPQTVKQFWLPLAGSSFCCFGSEAPSPAT